MEQLLLPRDGVLYQASAFTDKNKHINLTESDFAGTAVAFKDASLVYDGGGGAGSF